MQEKENFFMIGAGNVAWHFSQAMVVAGYRPAGVFSRTAAHASEMAAVLGCKAYDDLDAIPMDADIYIVSVKDDAISQTAYTLGAKHPCGLLFHTAGSISIDAFKGCGIARYGVVYPLQTFSKRRDLDFSKVPLFVEGCNAEVEKELLNISAAVSNVKPRLTSSANRKKLHLAAVFASNFANHCFSCAKEIGDAAGIDFRDFLPLIDETCAKIHDLSPIEAQTGPAVRYDKGVMQAQASMLGGTMRNVYEVMSRSIHEAHLNQ